jgi:hypothetical protein
VLGSPLPVKAPDDGVVEVRHRLNATDCWTRSDPAITWATPGAMEREICPIRESLDNVGSGAG